MKGIDIVRAWKDEEYRAGLSEAARKLLPRHPAGAMDIPTGYAFPAVVTLVLPITYYQGYTSTYVDAALGALVKITSTLIK